MNNYLVEDGDTVTHETINDGQEMSVVDLVKDGMVLCQLSDKSTQLIPESELKLKKKTGGGFMNGNEKWEDLKDNDV